MENSSNSALGIILLVALLLYVLSPVDAVPGPIDDIILVIMYCLSNK